MYAIRSYYDTIWWTTEEVPNDNKPVTPQVWSHLKSLVAKQLSEKRLFVMDTFCGANPDSRMKVRFIVEVAWQAHFVKNMFIRPTDEELENYGEPDFVVLTGSNRITSYNVCYTKLLRYKGGGASSYHPRVMIKILSYNFV